MRISKKLIIVLSAVPLLASCGGVSWKKYSYERVLAGNEKAELLVKVIAVTTAKVKSVEDNYYSLTQYANKKTLLTEKNKIEIFKKGEVYEDFSHVEKDESNGRVKNINQEREKFKVLFDESNNKFATASLTKDGIGNETYSYEEKVVLDAENKAAGDALTDVLDLLTREGGNELKAVETKKGEKFFIYNNITESHTAEPWGNQTKVLHKKDSYQDVVLLNEDFSIKYCSNFYSMETNKDTGSGKFSNKMKLENKVTREWKFTYGERDAASSKLDETRKLAKSGYKLGVCSVNGFAYDKDGNEMSSNNFTSLSSRRLSFAKSHVSFLKEGIPAKIVEDKVVTYKLKVEGNTVSNAKPDPVVFNTELKINNLNPGNSGTSLSGGAIKMGVDNIDICVEFDIEATSKGVTVSNVTAHVSSYVL